MKSAIYWYDSYRNLLFYTLKVVYEVDQSLSRALIRNVGCILTIYLLFRDIIIQSIRWSENTALIVKTSAKIFTKYNLK
jgi:hypothetical protein